jgi:ABC-type multidrug transport system fused ATPase/permease subunit
MDDYLEYSDEFWDIDTQHETNDKKTRRRFLTGIGSWWKNTKKSWKILYQISPLLFYLSLGKHFLQLGGGIVPVLLIQPAIAFFEKGFSSEIIRGYIDKYSTTHVVGLVILTALVITGVFITPKLGIYFRRLEKEFRLTKKLYKENLTLWIPYEYTIDSKKSYQLRKFYDFVDGIFDILNDQVGLIISVVSSIVAIIVGSQLDSSFLVIVVIMLVLQFINQYYTDRKEFSNANDRKQELLEMRTGSIEGALDFPDITTRLARQVNQVFRLFTDSSRKLIDRELTRDTISLLGERNELIITGTMYTVLIGFCIFKILNGSIINAMALYYVLSHIKSEVSNIMYEVLNQITFKRELGYVEHILDLSEQEKKLDEKKEYPSVDRGIHISIRNVWYHYPSEDSSKEPEWIFKNFSLEISLDKTYAVSAENGAGKTTFFNIVMGFLTPVSGEVFINDVPVSHIQRQWFNNYFTVYSQDMYIITGMTLAEFLSPDSISELNQDVIQTMRNILDDVGLSRKIKGKDITTLMLSPEYPNGTAFSSGETQKLLIARVLVTAYYGSQYGLVDEMTSNIPNKEQKKFAEILKKYTKGSMLIAHNPEMVSVCDRIITYNNYAFQFA